MNMSSRIETDADAIADCVLATFDQLPEKRKPRPRIDGSREWIPLAGIVLSNGGKLSCVSLGTGMKCLPCNKMQLIRGNVLHDWHAEVLAMRAFNRFLLDQCLSISTPPYPTSDWVRQVPPEERIYCNQPFTIPDDVSIHMYCSEAPCGDASMELVMDAQEDATPWTSAPPMIAGPSNIENSASLRGRSNFSVLGAVRCKPSRPDAPPTLSKSCTDKLALKQATSLLSSTAALLISPQNAYIHSLILPASQHVPAACERAFSRSGRLKDLSDDTIRNWKGAFRWQPFNIRPTVREFTWSRRGVLANEKAVASNLSAVWSPIREETLIGGVLQGRKQLDARGASSICRRGIWKVAVQVAALAGVPSLAQVLMKPSYASVKEAEELEPRNRAKREVKAVLDGWVTNAGDEEWGLDQP